MRPALRSLFALPVLALPLAFAAAGGDDPPKGPARAAAANPSAGGGRPPAANWGEIDKLVSEQKLEEAAKLLAALEDSSRARGAAADWARALVMETQVRIALGGYETAVEALKAKPWPSEPIAHAGVELYYAYALLEYLGNYGWEIGQREKIVTGETLDLKQWTRDQIAAEANRAFVSVWSGRAALGSVAAKDFPYLTANDFPAGIRDSLRDAVTYLYAQHLADTSFWSAEQNATVWQLDLASLIAGESVEPTVARLNDAEVHPLAKLAAVLGDLEHWHRGRKQTGATLEALRTRLEGIHGAIQQAADRETVRDELARRLPEFRQDAWWGMGQADLARFWMASGAADHFVRARQLAVEGERAFPGTPGALSCRRVREEIDLPAYSLAAMAVDEAGRRSLEISHKNLAKLYLRAYRLPATPFASEPVQYERWDDKRIDRLLGGAADASWTVELPATADFENHRTFSVPPVTKLGRYALVASADPGFRRARNSLQAISFEVSDLVLLREPTSAPRPDWEAMRVVSGATGRPVAGATLTLYRWQWEQRPSRIASAKSDADGLARFPDLPDLRQGGGGLTVVVGAGGDETRWNYGWSGWVPDQPGETTGALVFTDRAIYRPGQKVYWKILAYGGTYTKGDWKPVVGHEVAVELLDPNGEVVASAGGSTNGFGTAAGELVVPAGRLLGNWTLRTTANGQTSIGVEEYKRPTFEVTIAEPKSELRLNHLASLAGEARYYFGLPVTTGKVAWRVERQPIYPWWWDWYRSWRPEGSRIVASGTTTLDADGKFQLEFTPAADEREKSSGIAYRFTVTAEATDDGGETRGGSRDVNLGWVTVDATFDRPALFFARGSDVSWTIRRADLNGVARPGKASWKLVALDEPATTPLPAELPATPAEDPAKAAYATPGDRQRPRWETAPPYEAYLALRADGREVAHGELAHDERGEAKLALGRLAPGAYRLKYETRDAFGSLLAIAREIVVAGETTRLAVPLGLAFENDTVEPGGKARLWIHSGLAEQRVYLEILRGAEILSRRTWIAGESPEWIEFPLAAKDRGGFTARATLVADHQIVARTAALFVPWVDKQLAVEYSTFRDRLAPGGRETFRVTVKDAKGRTVEAGAAEILASMYDRSLDFFRPHGYSLPLGLYPSFTSAAELASNLGQGPILWTGDRDWYDLSSPPSYRGDVFVGIDGYGIGGPGGRSRLAYSLGAMQKMDRAMPLPAPASAAMEQTLTVTGEAPALDARKIAVGTTVDRSEQERAPAEAKSPAAAPVQVRSDFSETAFWKPQLLTGADGSAAIEFTVPDSVTSWKVWVAAVTKDLASGSAERTTESVKDLMVRPYLPRFLREGDEAQLKVVVNNASKERLSGALELAIYDPATNENLLPAFAVAAGGERRAFVVEGGRSADLVFPIVTPRRPGAVAFKVVARAGSLSDGELRPLPILPSRLHLAQSRFVVLDGKSHRVMRFADHEKSDPTRVDEQLVVTVDGQLFYSMLDSLPYLIDYPYECAEQTLNRFVSSGMLTRLFDRYPALARMAAKMATRDTQYERFDAADPNRKMALEETPWLQESRGKSSAGDIPLLKVLDPRIAAAQRDDALAKLQKMQLPSGAFPWFPGGPPSPYMTVYLLYGFSKATEFGVPIPKEMVVRGWNYVARELENDWLREAMKNDCCWETLTFANYVASSYPDPSWMGDAFPESLRQKVLDFSFKHWREHQPMLKLQLAMTLERLNRARDAQLVLASVMDSAKSDPDLGTFWQPEDRAWLWYNDTIETHAWAIRALMEIAPKDQRLPGLVQWLFLNKKLNHWKSTRATAEVLYSVARFLDRGGALAVREEATVDVAGSRTIFAFEPDEYTGKKNQIVVPGEKLPPTGPLEVTVDKSTPGVMFASSTWHFATDELPAEARGDLFSVERKYFKRVHQGKEVVLVPLTEGTRLAIGDEVEVQLSLRAKAAAEYVHLRDPRPAGLEPDKSDSGWRWNLGVAWYEETRDSGANFFFENLPAGEYPFRYRLRANLAGTFRAAPAQVQSMYAPEFVAYSAGGKMTIAP
ncbi:MAG: alpha-2-macroglobulin family protein [Thermoanaerobaculia bacterium]